MNKQKSQDILQFNKLEAEKASERKRQDVSPNILIIS